MEGLSAAVVGREIANAVPDWAGFVASAFRSLPIDDRVVRRARVLVRWSLRFADRSPWRGGVVVVGFGEKQIFPALSHYLLDGVIANRVRVNPGNHVQIGTDQSAGIYPFAQEDMVVTFMDGVHPGFRLALYEFVDETVALLAERFYNLVEGSLPAAIHRELQDEMKLARSWVTEHFESGMAEFLERNNSGPVMSVVEVLPKEELAEMAEGSSTSRLSREGSRRGLKLWAGPLMSL